MSRNADRAPRVPVRPNEQLYPNVDSRGGSDGAVTGAEGAEEQQRQNEEDQPKTKRFRLDRDTEVEVTEVSPMRKELEMQRRSRNTLMYQSEFKVSESRGRRSHLQPKRSELTTPRMYLIGPGALSASQAEDIGAVIQREKTMENQCHRYL